MKQKETTILQHKTIPWDCVCKPSYSRRNRTAGSQLKARPGENFSVCNIPISCSCSLSYTRSRHRKVMIQTSLEKLQILCGKQLKPNQWMCGSNVWALSSTPGTTKQKKENPSKIKRNKHNFHTNKILRGFIIKPTRKVKPKYIHTLCRNWSKYSEFRVIKDMA
jgi:hypothetical protein